MKELIKNFQELEKKDQIIFFLASSKFVYNGYLQKELFMLKY